MVEPEHAVPCDIGDENADSLLIHHKKIVKVSRHCSHRQIPRGDADASEPRHFPREDRRLDLAGDLELPLDGEQALFVRVRAQDRGVAKAADQREKTDGRPAE